MSDAPLNNHAGQDRYVILNDESPFLDIFPGGKVPVLNILGPDTNGLAEAGPDKGKQFDYYKLDIKAISPEQLEKVVKKLAHLFQSSEEAARGQIERNGFLPIRKSQVKEECCNGISPRFFT